MSDPHKTVDVLVALLDKWTTGDPENPPRSGPVSEDYVAGWRMAMTLVRSVAQLPSRVDPPYAEYVKLHEERHAVDLKERCERFIEQAQPGVMFLNELGRRSEILYVDHTRDYDPAKNGYKAPEYGPWYHVIVHWSDARPSEECMIWYTIGEPEPVR